MKITPTRIPEVIVFEPPVFGDDRGFFYETFRSSWFSSLQTAPVFVQDNHSKSTRGTLRGLHLQKENTQGKLVRVIQGEVFDVAVDMRINSPTYGQWLGEYLSAENRKVFWVPEGFAHGFVVTSDTAEFVYKCTQYYHPESDLSIAWDDPVLNIDWPVTPDAVQLSGKDKKAQPFILGEGFASSGAWVTTKGEQ